LYKLILKNKHDLQLRLRYISILLKNKEYTKAIKWCEKALHMANKSQKKRNLLHISTNILSIK